MCVDNIILGRPISKRHSTLNDGVQWSVFTLRVTLTPTTSQQTPDAHSVLGQCCASVADGGPALAQHRVNDMFTSTGILARHRRKQWTNIESKIG